MDPLVTSSLISAGSNLLGGMFGGKQKRPRAQDAVKYLLGSDDRNKVGTGYIPGTKISWSEAQGIHEENMVRSRIAAARRNNIHPLVALGLQPSAAPGVATVGGEDSGSRWGQALSDMGQGVSRAVAAYATREEREMAKLSSKLSLENQQLQNDRLRSEIALMHAPGSPPGLASADADGRYPNRASNPLGIDSASPRYIPLINPDGSISRVTSPDAGDNEVLMLWDFLSTTLPDEFRALTGRTFRRLKHHVKSRYNEPSPIYSAIKRYFKGK